MRCYTISVDMLFWDFYGNRTPLAGCSVVPTAPASRSKTYVKSLNAKKKKPKNPDRGKPTRAKSSPGPPNINSPPFSLLRILPFLYRYRTSPTASLSISLQRRHLPTQTLPLVFFFFCIYINLLYYNCCKNFC